MKGILLINSQGQVGRTLETGGSRAGTQRESIEENAQALRNFLSAAQGDTEN